MVNLLYVNEGGEPGGAEQNLLTVIKEIDKTQYRIIVCLLRPSDILEDALKRLGIGIFVLNMDKKWDIFSLFRLIRVMRREKIDILHSCLYASNSIGRVAAIFARIPVIIAWEQGEILYDKIPPRHFVIERILSKFSHCIVACSQSCKDNIITKEGIPATKIKVIYNCVDLAKFNVPLDYSTVRRQLGIGADEILIGTVATLDNERKGQEYLIRAMPKILNVYPKARLLLIGRDGSSKSHFVQIADSLNIKDRVIFTGLRRDIPEIVNALDLYVCPSIMEGLSISIIEAMASKKAVVATNVYGIPEVVIEGETGYLVPPKDENSIAKYVISLLADRGKMHKLGEAGFERVKTKFSSKVIIKEIESLYRELLCKTHPKYQ